MVALDTVKTFTCTAQATENVSTANDDADLNAHVQSFLNLQGIFVEAFYVDTVTLFAHQALATELQQNALKFCQKYLLEFDDY